MNGYSEWLTFLADEATISKSIGVEITYPIRLFNLRGLGIDQEKFIADMLPTYAHLPWDFYDMKREQAALLRDANPGESGRLTQFLVDYYACRVDLSDVQDLVDALQPEKAEALWNIKPYRRRSVARFRLTLNGGWHIERLPAKAFRQQVGTDDARALERIFAEMSDEVVSYEGFQTLLQSIAGKMIT